MNFNDEIDPDVQVSIERYVTHGVEPGGFLRAVLSNDLRESFGRADSFHQQHLFVIVGYCYNWIPAACWGSPEKVRAWLAMEKDERTRLLGMRKAPPRENKEGGS